VRDSQYLLRNPHGNPLLMMMGVYLKLCDALEKKNKKKGAEKMYFTRNQKSRPLVIAHPPA
jgi:hypothetical protein